MSNTYIKSSDKIEIPYSEYLALTGRGGETQNLRERVAEVIGNLQRIVGDESTPVPKAPPMGERKTKESGDVYAKQPLEAVEIPPIRKEIPCHFNEIDESGRLFNVFKQYYTFLNEACGGTVRITMKDGFCSLWNYDEWEEFAFVDIFEGRLRIALHPRYTDQLKSLNLCEVPRLLSNRRNLICLQVDDLNNLVLDVLSKAFREVGMSAA